jgi:beta-glucosidase
MVSRAGGGKGHSDVIFGDYNPSGRLPVTFYRSVDQIPAFDNYSMEGKTYRFFRDEPLYPFGYGLSFTTFEYEPVRLPESVPCGIPVDISSG